MHTVWDEIVNDEKFRVCIGLQAGEMMVIANQVCFKMLILLCFSDVSFSVVCMEGIVFN